MLLLLHLTVKVKGIACVRLSFETASFIYFRLHQKLYNYNIQNYNDIK